MPKHKQPPKKVGSPGPCPKVIVFSEAPDFRKKEPNCITEEEFGKLIHTHLFEKRERRCCILVANSTKATQCQCLIEIMRIVQAERSKLTSWNAHQDLFLMMAKILKAIVSGPNSLEAYATLCSHASFVNVKRNINSAPNLLLHTPIGTFELCPNGLYECGGHLNKTIFQKFNSQFLTPKSPFNHYTKLLLKKRLRAMAILALTDVLAEKKHDPSRGLGSSIVTAREVHDRMLLSGLLPKRNLDNLIRKEHLPKLFGFVEEMKDSLILAHPGIPSHCGGSDQVFYEGAKVCGRRIVQLHGFKSMGDVKHSGDGGVFFAPDCFQKMAEFTLDLLERTAGCSGSLGDKLESVNGQPYLRYLSARHDWKGPGLEALFKRLGSNDESPSFVPLVCRWLLHFARQLIPVPADAGGAPTSHRLLHIAGVMVNVFRSFEPKDDSGIYKAQAPHWDMPVDVQEKLLANGIHAMIAVMPLKGFSFLRLWRTLDTDDFKSPTNRGILLAAFRNMVTILPVSLIHAGGFRTFPDGNPRMHFYLFLIPEDMDDERAIELLPKELVNVFVGIGGNVGRHCTHSIVPRPKETDRGSEWFCEELAKLHEFIGF